MKYGVALAVAILVVPSAFAQGTTVTKTAPEPFSAKIGDVKISPSTSTTYIKPGNGPDGPIPGSQSGSSTTTTGGVTATIPMGDGKK